MIDTDKYEGHIPAPWCWKYGNIVGGIHGSTPLTDDAGLYCKADMNLIADAPLLLAEVKRLREKYERLHNATENILNKHFGSLIIKAFWEAIE